MDYGWFDDAGKWVGGVRAGGDGTVDCFSASASHLRDALLIGRAFRRCIR